jgi:DtxR family Mn-dependent transcriptional regulator
VGELLHEHILQHRVEDLMEDLYTLADQGRSGIDEVTRFARIEDVPGTLRTMARDGLVELTDSEARLTEKGMRAAREIVRRHRLGETLFSQLFDLEEEEAEKTACEFEHILSPQVTTSVCTYLGHPPVCPHGKSIPKGECCDTFRLEMEPLVKRLSDLRLGESGAIVFMAPDSKSRLARLSGLGVVPGGLLRLVQKRPSVVVEVGETTLALDPGIADEIFVKRTEG